MTQEMAERIFQEVAGDPAALTRVASHIAECSLGGIKSSKKSPS